MGADKNRKLWFGRSSEPGIRQAGLIPAPSRLSVWPWTSHTTPVSFSSFPTLEMMVTIPSFLSRLLWSKNEAIKIKCYHPQRVMQIGFIAKERIAIKTNNLLLTVVWHVHCYSCLEKRLSTVEASIVLWVLEPAQIDCRIHVTGPFIHSWSLFCAKPQAGEGVGQTW
jgi:hypothetical protein